MSKVTYVVTAVFVCLLYFTPASVFSEEITQDGALKRYEDIDHLCRENRFDDAERECKKKISQNKNDYVALTHLGEAYWKKDNRKAALKYFKKAVNIEPDYALARYNLGRAYFYTHKQDEAVKEFERFIELMDSFPEIEEDAKEFYVSLLHDICFLYSSQKKYKTMTKLYKKIIKLYPDDRIAHFNLAVCYYHLRKRPQAYNEMQVVMEIRDTGRLADRAKLFIDYMRRNPDPLFESDITFIYED